MKKDTVPCCAADALRRIRQVTVNGKPTGIVMLDECLAGVKDMGLFGDAGIRAELVKRVKEYNYLPPALEEEYGRVLLHEYQELFRKK